VHWRLSHRWRVQHTAYERTRHRPAGADGREVEVFGDITDRAGDDRRVVTEYKPPKASMSA